MLYDMNLGSNRARIGLSLDKSYFPNLTPSQPPVLCPELVFSSTSFYRLWCQANDFLLAFLLGGVTLLWDQIYVPVFPQDFLSSIASFESPIKVAQRFLSCRWANSQDMSMQVWFNLRCLVWDPVCPGDSVRSFGFTCVQLCDSTSSSPFGVRNFFAVTLNAFDDWRSASGSFTTTIA